MQTQEKIEIIIAHYGLDRKITQKECELAIETSNSKRIFIDMEAGSAKLSELYDLSFENIALAQQRKFSEILKPVLDQNPTAEILYFGLVPIPVGFHLGYLVGNTHTYTIYQWHHKQNKWYKQTGPPSDSYSFEIQPITMPQEKQKGKGEVIIRIGTSFSIDPQSTYDLVNNPANEFDIELQNPNIDSLFNQQNILAVVDAFQAVLNAYANKLSDREQIHLFISSSSGLPFALGTRINTNIYPFIQTYQFDRSQTPKHREAILISKENNDRIILSDEDRQAADSIRQAWEDQLQKRIKPFIAAISGKQTENWLQTVCGTDEEYKTVSKFLKAPWLEIMNIGAATLKFDQIDLSILDVDDGFEYIEKSNSWSLDDGFLAGLQRRLNKDNNTDLMQAARLFFFHEALHYSNEGHHLTKEIASGIGQFPKVIEEADYQADVWALLNEYRFCCIYHPEKLKNGIKEFFCNAIDTAVETMWSFVDNGSELNLVQVRFMNRCLIWYWQWTLIEGLPNKGNLEDAVSILLNKPIIELAGQPMELRAHRTFFNLNTRHPGSIELAAFINNRVHRFAPPAISEIVSGFKYLKGEKIKLVLKGFQVSV